MPFEAFINLPMPEVELLDQLVAEIQANYVRYQDRAFYMKLAGNDKASEIVWIKAFKDVYDLGDFHYDSVMLRACIMLKFHEGRYEILCSGFSCGDWFEIWPDKISGRYPDLRSWNDIEEVKATPRDILENGFGDISGLLNVTKRNKGA